jgi:cell division protein FtsQ
VSETDEPDLSRIESADHVPNSVLDELSAAFSEPAERESEAVSYNFDDPSIDRLLGLHPSDIPDAEIISVDDDEIFPDDSGHLDAPAGQSTVGQSTPGTQPAEIQPAETQPVTQSVAQPAAPKRTIVIDHDDQPDTVYLDDSGDERSTVVIGDLDDGVVAESAPTVGSGGPTAAIDPRMRARRIANRRAEGRRRLVWAAIIGVAVLLVVGAIAVVASPIFDVSTVRVQGAVYTDAEVLNKVIDSLKGEPVLLVDTRSAERSLEAVPWVERATVVTDFPHTVLIDIRERRPVATFQGGDQQFRVIDPQGRVLDVIAGQPFAYPLITGRHPDTVRGDYAGAPYASAGRLVLALPSEIRSLLIDLGLDSSTSLLSLQLRGTAGAAILVRLGDDSALDDKLARLLQQVRGGLDGVCGLDVSTSEVGVVRC